ncbi:hypothetical protein AUK40_01070 [Candidatus Wirthbacteria bacterium CG2_30_54_11]|uniref:Calcineurin-like phosphoesterase domain-containing protein n=1 Tax=Candidatus Wirthbacteria bacterium CG2_30_54_11 TaxID=1817892 RepID=A0A1J5J0L8_9BACT|nr:MAG: hypothetical protein AUK40_01070 [Candidatus Wirthbacteria bacterium CG2_30_54_11]
MTTILAFSDLHGQLDILSQIKGRIAQIKPNICLIAGDLTQFGSHDAAQGIVARLRNLACPVYFVHGNCDPPEALRAFRSSPGYVHALAREIGDFVLCGYGNVPPTPFGTFNEVPEEVISSEFKPENPALPLILLTHAPPIDINDLTRGGPHGGSLALRDILTMHEPLLMLHGHIHEAPGFTVYNYETGKAGQTVWFSDNSESEYQLERNPDHGVIINVAAAKFGRWVEIEISSEIISIRPQMLVHG